MRAYLASPSAATTMLQAKKSSERKQLVEMVTNYQLMKGITKLFTLDPMLALVSPTVCVCVWGRVETCVRGWECVGCVVNKFSTMSFLQRMLPQQLVLFSSYAHTLHPLTHSTPSQTDHLSECLVFMTGLVGLVQHQGISLLPIEASNVLLLLHQPENIKNWDPKDPMAAFWDVSGQVGVV